MANEAYHAKKSPLHCTNGAGSLLQLCRRILIESGVVSICLSLRHLFDAMSHPWCARYIL